MAAGSRVARYSPYPEGVTEPSEPARTWRDELLTWPNLISMVRLACVPVFVWLLLSQDERLAAAWLLAVLGATDWVDGWVARRFDQVSDVGKVLDPPPIG